MKKIQLFEDFVVESANIKNVAKNILDALDNTAQLHVDYIPKEALVSIESALKKNKSLSGKDAAKAAKEIRTNLEEIGILANTFSPTDVEIIIMDHLNEGLNEATTSWSKMMKGVKAGESGPWSLVAHENGKVVGQKNDIKVREILPAEFEAIRKEYPKAKIHIEDSTGGVVWNESVVNEGEKVIKGNFGVKKIQTLIDKYGRDNGLFFKRKSDGKLYGVGSIFLDSDNKDFAVIDDNGDDEYIDYKDIDYIVIKESVVNEAKTLTREELMDLLENKYKIKTVRTSEEFNGQTEGIWVAGDNEEELSGNRMFDYYNSSAKYANGVLKQLRTAVEKTGWWFEWNDPGTIIIWPNN